MEAVLRFLIAQKEYLIALDAMDILSGHVPAEIEIVNLAEFEGRLRQGNWDLVLLDTSETQPEDARNASMVLASGAALVFLTGYQEFSHGVPGFEEWPVAAKPFSHATLTSAASRALALAGKG
jgi:DNA-binding LytR/AlgR family response regulator